MRVALARPQLFKVDQCQASIHRLRVDRPAAEGHVQGGHGCETGRRWRVGSCEKWLYFSYIQPKPSIYVYPLGTEILAENRRSRRLPEQ